MRPEVVNIESELADAIAEASDDHLFFNKEPEELQSTDDATQATAVSAVEEDGVDTSNESERACWVM